MNNSDVRWKQRYSNYTKALLLLENALKIEQPDIVQKAGIIQFFEMCCELSWKVLKDYLEEQGFNDVNTPRNAIKKAFEIGIIENGHAWMDLLVDRNLSVHTYDEEKATDLELLISSKYFSLFIALKTTLESK
jgi:nucleotidyltransferase substrate binding protein (TIGR01987 family)